MITKLLIDFFKFLFDAIDYALPDWNPVDFDGFGASISSVFGNSLVGGLLKWLNFYLPLKEAITAAAVLIGLYLYLLMFRAAVYLLTKLHILGGSSA